MKNTVSIIGKLAFPVLLTICAIPSGAHADTLFSEGEVNNSTHAFHNCMRHISNIGHEEDAIRFPPEVDLTESQRDKIFSIRHTQAPLLYEQRKIIRLAHSDLHKLAISDQYDDEKAKAIAEKIGKALGSIIFLRVQEKHQMYSILTPEQRNTLLSHSNDSSMNYSGSLTGSEGATATPISHH